MDENITWHRRTMLAKISRELAKNNFTPIVVENAAEAVNKIFEIIKPEESVGIGGSRSIRQLCVIEALESRGQELIQNKPGQPPEEAFKLRRKALAADVYMESPNAVTMDGKLLFVDGVGNRVAGMIFGPKKVVAVAGCNKIVPDEESGWERIRQVAAPANAKRLGLDTPCTAGGSCKNCDTPQRICNASVVLWKRPKYTEYYVLLVAEELGY